MIMGLSVETGIPVITVFIQGLLSFFSPCVLPLVPLYVSYLAGGTKTVDENGNVHYPRKKVMVNTLFFVLGVSFTFFLLGFGFTAMGRFFTSNRAWFARVSGIIMILFGLYQLGLFGRSETIEREHRLPFRLDRFSMNPLVALILGFTFSFAWTPCVGPALASVLLMAASASTQAMGFVLIGVYTAGFVLPFLAVGLFTTSLLDFFKSHMNVVKYTVRIGGILMVFMGILMFTGKMNSVTGYLSRISPSGGSGYSAGVVSGDETKEETKEETKDGMESSGEIAESGSASGAEEPGSGENAAKESGPNESGSEQNASGETEPAPMPAIDFTLKDQYGNTHTLSDYKGKTVFLNFWATWCPPCRAEMPDIQKLYDTYDTEGDDALIVLGIAAPNMGSEQSVEGIKKFLEDNGYTYPVVMDTTGEIFNAYGIFSFPTTFMIDRDGNVFGYASGQLSEDMMKSIIDQTMAGKRK